MKKKIYKHVEFYYIYEKILDMEILFPFSDYEEYDNPPTKFIGRLSYLKKKNGKSMIQISYSSKRWNFCLATYQIR